MRFISNPRLILKREDPIFDRRELVHLRDKKLFLTIIKIQTSVETLRRLFSRPL